MNPPRLPETLFQSQDPIDGNPFAADDVRHDVWKRATARAEQAVHRFHSRLLEQQGAAGMQPDFQSFVANLVIGRFDIWANRTLSTVDTEEAATAYVGWLREYADASLQAVDHGLRRHQLISPEDLETDRIVEDLELRLIARVEHWRAEMPVQIAKWEAYWRKRRRLEPPPLNTAAERKRAVAEYIAEVSAKTQRRVTRKDLWLAVRYRTATEFERWQRGDPRTTKAAKERFDRLLTERPHLK